MIYLLDEAVGETLDVQLRALLSLCFGESFKHKRYAFELPRHRWLVREGDELVAHLAVHEKTFQREGGKTPFMGVAEVCVAPSHRGRGLVKTMLREAELHYKEVPFSILLGNRKVYGSSGYRLVDNVYFPLTSAANAQSGVLVKPLGSEVWPQGEVIVKGPLF